MLTHEEEVRRRQSLERRITQRVNALLDARDLHPRDLADILGVSTETVRSLLSPGGRYRSWETRDLRILATHFEMPVRYFFGSDVPPV